MIEEFNGVYIMRDVPTVYHRFTDFFKNFHRVPCVLGIFGEKTEEVLNSLKVEFYSSRWGYMGVSDTDGHLIVNAHYINTGNIRDIYLDIIHELVHVKQYMDGKPLFDDRFSYIDRPTEIEAYAHCIKEARRIGMSEEEIIEYLKTPWLDDEEVLRLSKALGVDISKFKTDSRASAKG